MNSYLLDGLKEIRRKREKQPKIVTAFRLFSKTLNAHLWVTVNEKVMTHLVAEGVKESIYISDELSKLTSKDISKDAVKAIHRIKDAFPGSIIENIEDDKF